MEQLGTSFNQTVARDVQTLHQEQLPTIIAEPQAYILSGGRISLHWMHGHQEIKFCIWESQLIGWTIRILFTLFYLHFDDYGDPIQLKTWLPQALKEFNIQNHIHCITSINATVNACMFIILERVLDGWSKKDGMVRCTAHTINLSAQKIPEPILGESDAGVQILEVSPSGVQKLSRKILSKIRATNILWEALEIESGVMKIAVKRPLLDMPVRDS